MKMYLKTGLLLITLGMISNAMGQTNKSEEDFNEMSELLESDGVRLTEIIYQVKVDATPEQVWEILQQYGNIASFHTGIASSNSEGNSPDKASLGCERACTIYDGKRKIDIKERVTEIKEGRYYRYEVYEWTNFPLKKMFNGFGVKLDSDGNTIMYQVTNYRLKPGFLTGMMKGKLKKGNRESLILYKHFIETGEKNAAKEKVMKMERYKNV